MSRRQNYTTNPSMFEEVDDDTFLQNSRHVKSPTQSTNPFADDLDIDQQRQLYEQKRDAIQQRTLTSSNRSIGLLQETEQVGYATAEELYRQREQLEKTNSQLDNIDVNLRDSQRHLNGIKSIFSGLKNYLSGTGQRDSTPRLTPSLPSGSKIYEAETLKTPPKLSPDELYESHPINRLKSDDSNLQKTTTTSSFSEQLDRNLDIMVGSLSRLKGLAMDMNQEIDSQDQLIDSIADKVDITDIKINKQNKDMNKLLGKNK